MKADIENCSTIYAESRHIDRVPVMVHIKFYDNFIQFFAYVEKVWKIIIWHSTF